MKRLHGAWIVVASMILAGCAASRPVIEVGGYYFVSGGSTYRIQSVNPTSKVGYNILALKEGDRDVVLGLDYDQDGVLDGVVEGQLSLQEASRVYGEGIAEGERRGIVRSRVQTQEFRTVINQYTYVLVTYHLAVGDVFNKLTILTEYYAPEEAILLDLGADGRLDTVEKGDKGLEHYQALYEQVLQRGMKFGRVVKAGGLYHVLP
jgi:hypothetical protein